MRALILILIGLLAGALGTSMLMRNLNRNSAYPKAVMRLQSAHLHALETLLKSQHCRQAQIQPHLLSMRIVAGDIEPAFTSLSTSDPQFVRYAADLRRSLDLQLAKSINTCANLNTAISSIEQSCDQCHRDYNQ